MSMAAIPTSLYRQWSKTRLPTTELDDYLVICGDNIFTSKLAGMLERYQRKRKAIVAVYQQKSLDEVKSDEGKAQDLHHRYGECPDPQV